MVDDLGSPDTCSMNATDRIEPVPPFRVDRFGEIELRQGGASLLLVFGIPFVLLGFYLALGIIGLVPVNDEFGKPLPRAATVILGTFSLGTGSTMIWGRRSVTFNLSSRSVACRYSVVVPVTSVKRPIADFDSILIVLWKGNSDTHDRYSVQLHAPGGNNFRVCASTDRDQSRRYGTFLANALNLSLSD